MEDYKAPDLNEAEQNAILAGDVDPDEAFEKSIHAKVGGAAAYATGMAGINSLPRNQVLESIRARGIDPYALSEEAGELLVLQIGRDAQKGFQEADRVTGNESVGAALAKIKVIMAKPEYLTSKPGDKIFEDVRLLHRLAFDR